jgi:NAD(P)H dehydrogenase (quinone)
MCERSTIFVTGATGKVGGRAFQALIRDDSVRVVTGVRQPDKANSLRQLGGEVRSFDLELPETLAPALTGVDRAVLLTGYSVDMLRQSMRFLDAARVAGVNHIVHVGASGAPTAEVAHWGWHRYIEAYIESLGFTYTHLRPESYMQNITGPGYRWLNGDVITHYIGNAKWTWIDANDVGEVVAAALRDPDRHGGKTYRLGVDGATMADVAEILSKATGRAIRAQAASPDEFLRGALASGADPAYMTCVYQQFQLDAVGLIPGAGDTYPDVEIILGRSAMTWERFAANWAMTETSPKSNP